MKGLVAFINIVFLLSGCTYPVKQLQEKVTGADSIAINYFKGDGTMDTVVAVKIIKDKKLIEDLTALITSGSSSEKNNCGYDGSIHFFKDDMVVQDVYFRNNKEGCNQFEFIIDGEKVVVKLSVKASGFLQEMKTK